MKQLGLTGLVLVLGAILGTSIPPLMAQSQTPDPQQQTCIVGEASGAACSGKWIFFAGNSGTLDESVWVVRIDSETGEIWYRNGKKLQLVSEVD